MLLLDQGFFFQPREACIHDVDGPVLLHGQYAVTMINDFLLLEILK
jgi:hypothetical protein